MSVSRDRRKRACFYQIDHGFDTDKTIGWMLKEYATDENITRVKDPEKLCRNIITMGGTGREREMNGQAFEAALSETRGRDHEAVRRQLDDARNNESELQGKVQGLQDELRNLERESANARILQLQEGQEPKEEAAV